MACVSILNEHDILSQELSYIVCLTLFHIGGGNDDPPQNVFDHCAETVWSRKLELCDF